MKMGPRTADLMRRFGNEWKQGQHVVVSGGTGSGKTMLARSILQERIKRGGFVIVFVSKLNPDKTILEQYKGFTRWTEFKKNPGPHESKVLLWPDTKGKSAREALPIQKKVFGDAFDGLSKVGKWTVLIDEGLYTCAPEFLNLAQPLAMAHALGRSSHLTLITNTQRPSHLPLIIYGSASAAFVAQTPEDVDMRRLANLSARQSSKALGERIKQLPRHEFLFIPCHYDSLDIEQVNFKK